MYVKRDSRNAARSLYDVAERQSGHFTAKQAERSGYSRRLQTYHTARGNWDRIDRGLYRLRLFPMQAHEDCVHWTLWSRDRSDRAQATVSHDSALALYDLSDVMPAVVHLTVPRTFRRRPPRACRFYLEELADHDVTMREGFRVTTVLRTLVDVAGGDLSPEHVETAVQDALRRGLVRRRQLEDVATSDWARARLKAALAASDVRTR